MANSGIHGFPLKATPVLADELGLVDSAAAWATNRATFTSMQTLMLTDGLVTTALTFPNTGLHILDTNATHDLIIAPGSNLTADRTLTLTTGDAARTLTLSGDATLNQDVSTAGAPTFVTETLSGLTASQAVITDGSKTLTSLAYDTAYTANSLVQRTAGGIITGTSLTVESNGAGDMNFIVAEAMTANRTLNVRLNDASRVLQVYGDTTISQDYSVTGTPQFASLRLTYSPSYYLDISVVDSAMANRTLGLSMGDQNRLITLQGDLTFGGAFTTSGSFAVTQTYTGITNVTFPTSGTLATVAGGVTITDDTTTNATMYPVWVTASSGTLPSKVSSTKLTFNPNTGTLTSTSLTASSGTLTINASNFNSTGGTNNFLVGTGASDILNIQVYDVDNTQYRTFCALSAGNTPSVVWSQPSGGTLTWDGGAIGATTPAVGSFTALKETTSYTSSRTGTAVSANAVSTITGVTSNAAARTITLLTADCVAGRIKIIKDEAGTAASSFNITIDTQGAELIDGAATATITANYGVLRVYADGSNWFTY